MNRQLKFREDGTFRILYLSDFQEPCGRFSPRTMEGVELLLDREQPDLVILGGDNCDGHSVHCEQDLRGYLTELTGPMVRRGIPFGHVFGNHDYDAGVSAGRQMDLYQEIPGCLSKAAPGVPGYTNYVLPVYSADGKSIVNAVWALDSGRIIEDFRPGLTKEAIRPGMAEPANIWDIIKFEQLMWYWNASSALEKEAGHVVPGVMAFHIAPWEFVYMRTIPEQLDTEGHTDEAFSLGAFNSGVFSTVLQRGDIRMILSAHTHRNTCRGVYCGIQLCSVGSAGYSSYGEHDRKGGRIVELNEREPERMITRMAFFGN